MNTYYTTFSTPFGSFSAAVDEAGALVATAFGERDALASRLHSVAMIEDAARLAAVREQLEQYFAGARRDFSLRLAPAGTAFQRRVWTTLTRIQFGETTTYRALAAGLGKPGAARAVGRANATNPICLIVPCHRVIGADGSLTGFAFGEEIKRRLLVHERVPAFLAA